MNDSPPTGIDAGEPTAHYDAVVDAWGYLLGEDLHYGFFSSGTETLAEATDALTDQMLALARLQEDHTVLDIGCGTGKAGCRIAGEFDSRVLGISPSTACVEGASSRAEAAGLGGRTEFTLGDGTKLQFDDHSFDRVWIMESSHLMDDKTALIREASRVLRPGGRVVLCDLMLQKKLSLEEVIQYRDEFLLLKAVFGRARMETLAFYREQFESQGLTVDHAGNITRETGPTFDRWRENATRARQSVVAEIGEVGWGQFVASCDVLESLWKIGVMGYGILSACKPSD